MRKLLVVVLGACMWMAFQVNAETIDLNGASRTLTSADDLTAAKTYTNSGGAIVDLTIAVNEGERIFADAVISGNIRLVKEGLGRLCLNAANEYVGGTLWKSGYLEANNSRAFGAAKTTVKCLTSNTGIHDGDLWFYLLAAGDYDYTFDFQNSNVILWSLAGGVHVLGDVIDSSGAATGEIWLIGGWSSDYRLLMGWNRPNAALGIGISNSLLFFEGSVMAKNLDASTCYRKSDWRDVAEYADWKANAIDDTRAGSGTATFNGDLNTFGFYSANFSGFAVTKPNCLSESMRILWDKWVYGGVNIDLGGTVQTVDCLGGGEMGESDASNFRLIKSDNAAELTLRASESSSTCARIDGAVSVVYDAQDPSFTQAFVGTRNHLTSGSLTAKAGTLELGGETSWPNLTGLAALDCATVSVSTTAATPFDAANLTVAIEGSGVVRTDRTLTVRCATMDGVPVDAGTYTSANCSWVVGEGSVTVTQWELTLTSAEFAKYAEKTIVVPEGGALGIVVASGEDAVFSGAISGAGGVLVTGAGTLTLTGDNSFTGGLTFDGAGRLYAGSDTAFGAASGMVTVTRADSSIGFKDTVSSCRNPICITATTGTSYLRFQLATTAKSFDIYSKIKSTAPTTFVMRDTTGGCGDGECVVNFYGDIDATGKTFGKSQTVYDTNEYMTLNFYGKITCALFYQDTNNWGYGWFHFYAANDIGEVSPAIVTFNANADGCWANAVLSGGYQRSDYQAGHGFDFHGHSMTIAGFRTYNYGLSDGSIMALKSTGGPATITVTGEGVYEYALKPSEGRTVIKLNSGVSLVWAPSNASKGILYNSKHTTEGTITVEKGILATEGAVEFANLSGITVRKGATFELNTTKADALSRLSMLVVEAGATFKVTAGETPFANGLLALSVGDDTSVVELPDGLSITVPFVSVNGVIMENCDIEPGPQNPWLRGNGVKLTVAAGSRNFWKPKAGSWNVTGNWCVGIPSEMLNAEILAWGNLAVTATVDSAAGSVAGITVGSIIGSGNATVAVKSSLGLIAGQNLEVIDRGVVEIEDAGSIDLPDSAKVYVRKGGELKMTGGTLSFANSYWGREAIQTADGSSVNLSGTARIQAGNETMATSLFGGGVVTFAGSSSIGSIGHLAGIWLDPVEPGCTGVVRIVDHAAWFPTAEEKHSVFLNVGSSADRSVRLEFNSDADSYLGQSPCIGEGNGHGELTITDGSLYIDCFGLFVAGAYNRQGTVCRPSGIMRVNGGDVEVRCVTDFGGTLIGGGYNASTDGTGRLLDNHFTGRLDISGGALRNTGTSMLIVGVGQAEAELNQSGGLLTAESTSDGYPSVVGMAGAQGTWTMTGGEATLSGKLYVGGLTTNELGRFVSGGDGDRRYPAELGMAGTGKLMLSGGTLTVAKDLVFSADGTGMLLLKPGCKLAVAGNLDARTGSKLVIDCRGYTGGSKTLATFGGTTEAFTDIEFLKDEGAEYTYKITDASIRVSRIRGCCIMVR